MAENGTSSAEDVKQQASQAAGGVASQVQDTVRTQVDDRSTQAGEQVSSTASDLRSVGEQLRSQDNEQGAKLADGVAKRAEHLGDYLKDSDADTILSDVEDLGRRQPWLALAGGVVAGVAAARFLKASSSSRYGSSPATRSSGASGYGAGAAQPIPPATQRPPTPTQVPPVTGGTSGGIVPPVTGGTPSGALGT